MANHYAELSAVADKLVDLGDQQGAEVVRRAVAQLSASEHEIERLLVDIESLRESLQNERSGK